MNLPPPVGGWKIVDGRLEIAWMTRPSAPDSLIECVSCKCKTGCKTQRCSCRKSELQCTDVCGCSDCSNIYEGEDSEGEGSYACSNFSDDDEDSDCGEWM